MTRDEELYVDSLKDDLRRAARMIEDVESGAVEYHGCPWCGQERPREVGHRDGCPVPSFLARVKST
jgi:hypothetical protein